MNIILSLGIMSICSVLVSMLLKKVKLPAVTGYLIAGLIIGPSFSGIVPSEHLEYLSFISDIALGIIAFHIGESFELRVMKKIGKSIMVITFFESFVAVIFVFTALRLYTQDTVFSLIVAAIAAATAPAATIMVINEYKSRGPLTNTLISVVALDDLFCIVLYSISVAIAQVLTAESVSVASSIFRPIFEIFGAFALGTILGFLLNYTIKKIRTDVMFALIPMSFVLIGVGIALEAGFSSLLTCVALGATVANLSSKSYRVFDTLESVSNHIYLLFFTISGMSLNITVLKSIGIIGLLFIFARAAGKYCGAFFGCTVTKQSKTIRNNLGIGLLPEAGVAIGLASVCAGEFPMYGREIMNLIMAAVFVYELIGPYGTKKILIKSGEAKEIN